MIDYQSIINELDDEKIKNMLEKLNIPYQDKGSYLLLPTCCHHSLDEETSWKLYYYKNTHIFHCFTEDGSQSIFTFLKNSSIVSCINEPVSKLCIFNSSFSFSLSPYCK